MNVMQKPLVSIIMPVYNMGEHLRKSVPSVLNQTYENIELILVDDGSKDNSLEVCRELAVKDNRIARDRVTDNICCIFRFIFLFLSFAGYESFS